MRNTVVSSYVRPTIWTPVGTPLDAHPDGTASTGQRLKMLNAMVMIVSLMGSTHDACGLRVGST